MHQNINKTFRPPNNETGRCTFDGGVTGLVEDLLAHDAHFRRDVENRRGKRAEKSLCYYGVAPTFVAACRADISLTENRNGVIEVSG